MNHVKAELDAFEIIVEELSAWDLLFAFAAMALAFGTVFAKTKQEQEEREALARRAAQRVQSEAA